jgi:flagellar hook protein FlgE
VASVNASNQLVLTANDAISPITVGSSTPPLLLTELGISGTAQPTNLLTQSAVAQGQTLVFKATSGTAQTITFGTGAGQIETLGQLSAFLSGLPVASGLTASVNALNGDITVTASNPTDQITVSGTATASVFGIKNPLALPSNGTVIGNDNTTFLSESLSGGQVTAFDATGAPVNIQLRWAKVNGVAEGGTDTWNLFYQVNSTAIGQQVAWQNVGTNFTFTASGQMSPQITTLPITNLTVNDTTLGNVTINFGTGGITQFADTSGNVNINQFSQNGSAAGSLQSLSISSQGRIDGTFSNGRTIDLAEIPLATFNGTNFLQKLEGGAFAETPESGTPLFNAGGSISGSSTEASNTDVADEFSKLIVTQQAYSANTKIITTGDQMVQALLAMIQ